MKISQCRWCGKSFEHVSYRQRRFCSKSCASKVRIREKRPPRIKTGLTRPCVVCGQAVYVKVWQQKKGFGQCCSRVCKDKWAARNSVRRPCEWCGKEMAMSPFRAAAGQRFCSMLCRSEGSRKNALNRIHNGKRAHNFKGYVWLWEPDNPKSYRGWIPEHRLVMQQSLDRYLESDEHVHHLNGIKDDNRLENLVLLSAGEHTAITSAVTHSKLQAKLAELEEYRRRFGPLTET